MTSRVEDDDGDGDLHYAAASGNMKMVRRFATNVDVENNMGWTPLMCAARNGYYKTVGLLLKFGADVKRKNKLGSNVLVIAAASGNVKTVEILLHELLKEGLSIRDLEKEISPIFFAVLFDRASLVKYFIKKSFEVNPIIKSGVNPLHFAMATKNTKMVDLLVSFGVDPVVVSCDSEGASNVPMSSSPIIDITHLKSPGILYPMNLSPIEVNSSDSSYMSPVTEHEINYLLNKGMMSSQFNLSAMSKSSGDFHLNSSEKVMDWFRQIARRSKSCSSDLPCQSENYNDDVFENPVDGARSENVIRFKRFLRRHSLDSHMSLFKSHEIDLDVFFTLNDNDLQEIGIKSPSKRRNILKVINNFNDKVRKLSR